VLGFSATTLVAAKAITSNQVATQKVDKTLGGASGLGAIFQDDAGYADLGKVQLIAWTLIAIVAYLVNIVFILGQVPTATDASGNLVFSMPDIDDALMVLMGFGSGAYLGKKLVTTDTPRVTSVQPRTVPAGDSVTLTGLAFGAQQGGSIITINGNEFYTQAKWGDAQIVFTIPGDENPATHKPWTSKQDILIGVEVNGTQSANTVPCTVTKGPSIAGTQLSKLPTGGGTKVIISGLAFGAKPGRIDYLKSPDKEGSLPPASWTDTKIELDIPDVDPTTKQAFLSNGEITITVLTEVGSDTTKITIP
jgi:hypothetical protein